MAEKENETTSDSGAGGEEGTPQKDNQPEQPEGNRQKPGTEAPAGTDPADVKPEEEEQGEAAVSDPEEDDTRIPKSGSLLGQVLLSGNRSLLGISAAISFVLCAFAVAVLSLLYPIILGEDGNTFLIVSTINFLLKIIGASAIVLLILAINRQAFHVIGLLVIAALVIATPDIIRIALIATGSEKSISDFYSGNRPPETQSQIVGNATNDVDRILTLLEDKNYMRRLEQERRRTIYKEYSSLKFSERVGILVERAQRNSSIIPLAELARQNFEAWSFRYTSDNAINGLLDQLKSDGLIVFVSNDYKTSEITALGCSVVSTYADYPFDLRFPHKLSPSDYTLSFRPKFVENFPGCAFFHYDDVSVDQEDTIPAGNQSAEILTVWENSEGEPLAPPATRDINADSNWQIVEFSVSKTADFNIDVRATQIGRGDPIIFLYKRPEAGPEEEAGLHSLADHHLIDENDDHGTNSPLLDTLDSRIETELEANQRYWLVLRDLPEAGETFEEDNSSPTARSKVSFTISIREITELSNSEEPKDP